MTGRTIAALGDSAITVTFGDVISESMSDLVVAHARRIQDENIGGVTDIVPSYSALGVYYDPLTISFNDLRDRLRSIEEVPEAESAAVESATHRIAVSYDGEDLGEVARATGLTIDEVIRIHSEREYRVFVIGFVPGFAYLGPLDDRLVLPRRAEPRKRVPAGSVAIAERQTGVYPSVTAGGWHLIGRTSAKMFDAFRTNPGMLAVGDRVKFEA